MKIKYRHIHFEEMEPGKWVCFNNKNSAVLAQCEFYKPWRKHIVFFSENAVFDETCLADIQDFLKQLNNKPQDSGLKAKD